MSVAIKQMLYRAGKQVGDHRWLVAATEGKSVTAVVELQGPLRRRAEPLVDRAGWSARESRSSMAPSKWKTHAKVSMVIRREGSIMRTYCDFGTGNYHPTTAKIYTDLSYFTASRRAARDAAKLFNPHHRPCETQDIWSC